MRGNSQKLILVSFFLAILASLSVFMYLKSLKEPDKESKSTTVWVASETIPARTLIDKSMIKQMEVPVSSIFDDYIKDSSNIIGKYTKETISKNEGFIKDNLINDDEEELSLKVDSKHRAISVSVTGDGGVAYLVKPGDFVDVVVYLGEKKDGTETVREDMAKMILQNIEILAVNSSLNREKSAEDKSSEKANNAFLVTLSVPTSDIEKLVLAENIGNIKLVLRPIKDDSKNSTNGVTWEELTVQDGTSDELPPVQQDENNSGSAKYQTYKVKRGDTLKKISEKFYKDSSKYSIIQKANNIENVNLIITGEIIKIPILD